MNRLRMLLQNLWDSASVSVTTGGAVPSLPIENSQRQGRSYTAAITPDAAGVSVVSFDCGELTIASGIVLYRHWLSNVAHWRLELFDGSGQTGNCVYDSGNQECTPTKLLGELDWLVDPLVSSVFDNWPHKYSQLWFDETFFQSGRLTLMDMNSRDGVHEFDRVYLGRVFTPSYNFSYGHSHQWQSSEQPKRTSAGSSFSVERQKFRQFSFNLDYISEAERPHLSEAVRKVGLSGDWFISMFPEQGGQKEIEYAMSCKFMTTFPLTGNAFNNYTAQIAVQEA